MAEGWQWGEVCRRHVGVRLACLGRAGAGSVKEKTEMAFQGRGHLSRV